MREFFLNLGTYMTQDNQRKKQQDRLPKNKYVQTKSAEIGKGGHAP